VSDHDTAPADRPEHSIAVGGTPASPAARQAVVAIDVSESVGAHGRLSLLVTGTPEATAPYALGAAVSVSLGYHDALSEVFSGIVTAVTAHFGTGGSGATVQVEARSRSVLLAFPRPTVIDDTTDGDVATELAKQAALDADTVDGMSHPVVHVGARPWTYLVDRAHALGWVTYVRGTVLVHRPPAESENPVRLEWNRNLTELHLAQDLLTANPSSEVTGWDVQAAEVVTAQSDAARLALDVGSRSTHAAAYSAAKVSAPPALDESGADRSAAEADARAEGSVRRAEQRFASGAAVLRGTPALRCDSWATVSGVEDRFAGAYYVSGVRHRLSRSGYTTEVQLGTPPRLLPPAPETGAASAAATTLLVGQVADLADPDGLDRVGVSLRWRTSAPQTVWARIATSDAGDSTGAVFTPEVGTDVVLGFLGGSWTEPVVLGTLWNGATARPVPVTHENETRGIFTRGGHSLVFDDASPGGVTVTTGDGRSVALSDKDERITLDDGPSGNSIELSGSGIVIAATKGDITLETASGSVKVSAMSLDAALTGTAKISSSAKFDISASGPLALTGALVKIN
jgi:uncharacterized protein involved in type VI secretion and phage assembly